MDIHDYSDNISIVTRESGNAWVAIDELLDSNGEIVSDGYVKSMKGKAKINKIHVGMDSIDGVESADTIFLPPSGITRS